MLSCTSISFLYLTELASEFQNADLYGKLGSAFTAITYNVNFSFFLKYHHYKNSLYLTLIKWFLEYYNTYYIIILYNFTIWKVLQRNLLEGLKDIVKWWKIWSYYYNLTARVIKRNSNDHDKNKEVFWPLLVLDLI